MATTLIVVGIFSLILSLYPLTFYPFSLMLLARGKRSARPLAAMSDRPSVAICVSAYNEEQVIVAKAHNLLAAVEHYGPATIHIYVDGSADQTAALLAPFADRIDVVVSPVRSGKTVGMRELMKRSDSEFVVFSDANVVMPVDAIEQLVGPFRDPRVGCSSAKLEIVNAADSPTSKIATLYWRIQESIKKFETATIGAIGVDGALFMVRRKLYSLPPPQLIDDLYVSLKIIIAGYICVSVPSLIVEERTATHWREECDRKTRIACQALNVHKTLWSELWHRGGLSLYGYVSSRLLKWMMPFTMLAGLVFIVSGLAMMFGVASTMLYVGGFAAIFLLLAALRVAPARQILVVLSGLFGVGRGVLQSIFLGRTYTYWTPAASIRNV